MTRRTHRPEAHGERDGSHRPRVVKQLRRALSDVQRDFTHDSLRLGPKATDELAGLLVDFAFDLHNGTGIWTAYERNNTEFFGTALPLTSIEASDESGVCFYPDRFRHFLWLLYPMLLDGLVLSPTHQDLRYVSEASSEFLSSAFSRIPRDCEEKTALRGPNVYGWDVKRKLVWLGTQSFMFRLPFARYMEEHGAHRSDISRTDDFICQECTRWSGLGAIDVLAGVLDVCADDRRNLRSWHERHIAFYKILSADGETLRALNVVNDQPYRIRINLKRHPFKAEQLVFGSLVPWRGEWYWSGEQQLFGDASKVDVGNLVKTMKRQSPGVVCRYSKEYETQVRGMMAEMYTKMLAFHDGKDLVVYPDGLTMAADWQKELRRQWESKPQQVAEEVARKHGLKRGQPEINLPENLLNEKNGLGTFLNPDEGKEIMNGFTTLVNGLKKKGEGLTGSEEEVIRGFFDSPVISPRFVKRVLEEYGDASVKKAFLLKEDLPDYWLDYLLRSHKGHFYRKRYPSLSVV